MVAWRLRIGGVAAPIFLCYLLIARRVRVRRVALGERVLLVVARGLRVGGVAFKSGFPNWIGISSEFDEAW